MIYTSEIKNWIVYTFFYKRNPMSATSQVSSPRNEHIGYWVEPFVSIIRGKDVLSEDQFCQYAKILYSHRIKGNPLGDNILELDSNRTIAIEYMREDYLKINGETDLVKRAVLLNTLFMRTIAQNPECPLTEDQKRYVTEQALPAALNSCSAKDILDIEPYKEWLKNYMLGCALQSVIAPHADLFSGYSEEERFALTQKRLAVSQAWYLQYKAGKVEKTEIQLLLDKLKADYNQNADGDFAIENPIMQAAFEGYKAHAQDFPCEKRELYWDAIFSALEAFLLRAN